MPEPSHRVSIDGGQQAECGGRGVAGTGEQMVGGRVENGMGAKGRLPVPAFPPAP